MVDSVYRFQDFKDLSEEETLRLKVTRSTMLTGTDVNAKRQEIMDYFHNTYTLYEKLFEPLSEKAFYMRADPLRHPLIFYFGHTAVLFINKLRLAKVIKARVNKKFESMFAVGVDEMSWDDLLPDNYDWPSVSAVKSYRDQVRSVVEEAIQKTPLKLPITWDDPFWAILMGIEHERIHLETSAVLIRQLPLSELKPHPFWAPCRITHEPPTNELVPVAQQNITMQLGKPYDFPLYGWDNEYGMQETQVAPFRASRYLVTNAEYLEFVEAGGYEDRSLWTEEGWRWATFKRNKNNLHPLFWVRKSTPALERKANNNDNNNNNNNVDENNNSNTNTTQTSVGRDQWKLRLMLEEVDMPWDWPVETNYLEAKAFCNWKARQTGKSVRLPLEDEYHVMRDQIPVDQHTWERAPGNINLEYFCSSTPVDHFPPTSGGLYDVIGNVWQHTETPIDAFRGFRVHPLYDDFSVPTFDLQHNLLKGGSWISTGNEATYHARYAFRRHFYQCAGFRYVESERHVQVRTDAYEKDSAVTLYVHFHYGPDALIPFGVANFPRACAQVALQHAAPNQKRRALDLGCATGRAVFELAREFDQVVGLDFSARFIRWATQLQEKGSIRYEVTEEGDLTSSHEASLVQLGLDHVKNKCQFFQADACNLDPRWSNFDLIMAINLVDRLYDPRLFLSMIHERINRGGRLVLGSPYTWDAEYTPREAWLGGYKDLVTGLPVRTLDTITAILTKDNKFRLLTAPIDVPFVIRETARKNQHTLSQLTVWERL